jgi:hypothetical protein
MKDRNCLILRKVNVEQLGLQIVHKKKDHLVLPPRPPKFGFCLRRGLASWAASEGAEGPIREYNSREMPSGFRALGGTCFFVWDGPAEELASGIESALRISAAEAAIVKSNEDQVR